MAQLFQEPHVKPGSAIALVGEKGTGKSKAGEWLASILGEHALAVYKEDDLLGNFNAHLESKLLIVAEEAVYGGDPKADSAMKHLITGRKAIFTLRGATPRKRTTSPSFCSREFRARGAGHPRRAALLGG
jgi:hypothetical protein